MRARLMVAIGVMFALTPAAFAEQVDNSAAAVDSAEEAEARARIAAVQAHVDAYRSGNLDRFVATFTPDAEVYANGMVAVGREQIRALYAANFAPGAPSIRIDDSGINGELVFLSVGYVFADGREMCCSLSEYEVSDGKIAYLATSG